LLEVTMQAEATALQPRQEALGVLARAPFDQLELGQRLLHGPVDPARRVRLRQHLRRAADPVDPRRAI